MCSLQPSPVLRELPAPRRHEYCVRSHHQSSLNRMQDPDRKQPHRCSSRTSWPLMPWTWSPSHQSAPWSSAPWSWWRSSQCSTLPAPSMLGWPSAASTAASTRHSLQFASASVPAALQLVVGRAWSQQAFVPAFALTSTAQSKSAEAPATVLACPCPVLASAALASAVPALPALASAALPVLRSR